MNKKILKNILLTLFLIILILAIILIPLIVNASKKCNPAPKLYDIAIEEANQKERERELAYKAQFAEEHKNKSNTNALNENTSDNSSYEPDKYMEAERKKAEEKTKKQNDIIKRYYPEEYERLGKEMKEYYDSLFVYDLQNGPLIESERELYDLVLNILENEDLSDEDTTLLKDYIKGSMYNIKKDENLKARADKILQ